MKLQNWLIDYLKVEETNEKHCASYRAYFSQIRFLENKVFYFSKRAVRADTVQGASLPNKYFRKYSILFLKKGSACNICKTLTNARRLGESV